ncbi:MAG: hypothetical protein NTX35_07070 [Verrucomicrobia bacterium]|nr:hypothetical protein [Verrucomicrobiota bacterium]
MNRLTALCLLLLTTLGCSVLPRDEFSRRQVYEHRLSRLEFPVTRARLYKTLRPAAPARPTGDVGAGLFSSSEVYRLDDVFVVELSVVYKAVANTSDYLNPSGSIGGQVRAILDATQSIDNFMTRGTPENPADIVQKARIVQRPVHRY